jgi:hypothetical protein
MYCGKRASSMKQMAYAKRVFGAQCTTKKEIALDVGYSANVANSISSHIENKPGFNYAMTQLAVDSNNLALAAMSEFKARGFKEFSNKDLIGALNAIGSAWTRFNQVKEKPNDHPTNNKLRTVILQQIENQTLNTSATKPVAKKPPVIEVEVVKEGEELDF